MAMRQRHGTVMDPVPDLGVCGIRSPEQRALRVRLFESIEQLQLVAGDVVGDEHQVQPWHLGERFGEQRDCGVERQPFAVQHEELMTAGHRRRSIVAPEVVEILLDAGADVNATNQDGHYVFSNLKDGVYRVEAEGRVICYSADTEWTETLIPAARNADLFVAEAYYYDRIVKNHLSLTTLEAHLGAIDAKQLVLTHMSDDMLGRLDKLPYSAAKDGMIVEL